MFTFLALITDRRTTSDNNGVALPFELTAEDAANGDELAHYAGKEHFAVTMTKNKQVFRECVIVREFKNSVRVLTTFTNERFEKISEERKTVARDAVAPFLTPCPQILKELSPLHFS